MALAPTPLPPPDQDVLAHDFPLFARCERAKLERTEPDALERCDVVADVAKHLTNLPIFSLAQLHQQVRLAPAATARLGDRVRFSDGSEQAADAILYGTGYRTEFHFLSPELQHPTYSCAPLYRGIVSLAAPNLFYAGLAHAHGALIPVFEAQANWIGDVLAGRLSLPATEVMSESITHDESIRARDFDPRHGILWDRLRYVRALDAESRHARRRPGVSRRAAAPTVT